MNIEITSKIKKLWSCFLIRKFYQEFIFWSGSASANTIKFLERHLHWIKNPGLLVVQKHWKGSFIYLKIDQVRGLKKAIEYVYYLFIYITGNAGLSY